MNIHFNFYVDEKEASLVDFHIGGSFVTKDRDLFEGISAAADTMARAYIEALNTLLGTPDLPVPSPIDPIPVTPGDLNPEDPIPVPTPVNPPVVDRSVQTAPDLTMEDVRKALIEVKKTKGVDGLKRCFSVVGAGKLTDVDPAEYGALYAAARSELNAK